MFFFQNIWKCGTQKNPMPGVNHHFPIVLPIKCGSSQAWRAWAKTGHHRVAEKGWWAGGEL